MKRIIFGTIAALSLTACVTTVEKAEPAAIKVEMVCATENPDGSCACKTLDANDNCVEGGGPAVIVRGDRINSVCAIENPDGTCACETVDVNGNCVEGGGPGVIVRGGNQ